MKTGRQSMVLLLSLTLLFFMAIPQALSNSAVNVTVLEQLRAFDLEKMLVCISEDWSKKPKEVISRDKKRVSALEASITSAFRVSRLISASA